MTDTAPPPPRTQDDRTAVFVRALRAHRVRGAALEVMLYLVTEWVTVTEIVTVKDGAIAKALGLDERTVRRAKRELESAGFIATTHRPGAVSQVLLTIPALHVTPDTDARGADVTPDTGAPQPRTRMSGDPGHGCPPTPGTDVRGTPDDAPPTRARLNSEIRSDQKEIRETHSEARAREGGAHGCEPRSKPESVLRTRPDLARFDAMLGPSSKRTQAAPPEPDGWELVQHLHAEQLRVFGDAWFGLDGVREAWDGGGLKTHADDVDRCKAVIAAATDPTRTRGRDPKTAISAAIAGLRAGAFRPTVPLAYLAKNFNACLSAAGRSNAPSAFDDDAPEANLDEVFGPAPESPPTAPALAAKMREWWLMSYRQDFNEEPPAQSSREVIVCSERVASWCIASGADGAEHRAKRFVDGAFNSPWHGKQQRARWSLIGREGEDFGKLASYSTFPSHAEADAKRPPLPRQNLDELDEPAAPPASPEFIKELMEPIQRRRARGLAPAPADTSVRPSPVDEGALATRLEGAIAARLGLPWSSDNRSHSTRAVRWCLTQPDLDRAVDALVDVAAATPRASRGWPAVWAAIDTHTTATTLAPTG